MEQTIYEFKGEYAFLSNFYPSPIAWWGKVWPTSEHLYQAAKTTDRDAKETIRRALTPGIAKKMGSRDGWDGFQIEIRPHWDAMRIGVTERILKGKFHQSDELRERLLSTAGYELVEGNRWGDRFWGMDLVSSPPQGENWLGKLLMLTRYRIPVVVIEF